MLEDVTKGGDLSGWNPRLSLRETCDILIDQGFDGMETLENLANATRFGKWGESDLWRDQLFQVLQGTLDELDAL